MAKNKGLGRGLDSLIPTEVVREQLAQSEAKEQVQKIDLSSISSNPHQPRTQFDQESINQLAASLDAHGLMQPVVVIEKGSGYQLIAGERRVRAAKSLGWKTIKALIRSEEEQSQLELALVENIQRDDLNAIDVASAYIKLVEEFNVPIETIAKRAGKAGVTIRNTIRLLNLPGEAKKALAEGDISEGHARQILALKEKSKQLELLSLIIKNGWSVRKAEQFAKAYKQADGKKEKAIKRTMSETPFTKDLSKRLKAPVKIQNMAKGGRLIIEFKDEEELSQIRERLQ